MKLKDLYAIPGKVVVTAHRGFSGRYPENTLEAFRRAMELGVDVVEFDIRETLDGELVVLHDATLERTTDGSGPVIALESEAVRRLNAAVRFEGNAVERIPRFTEALDLMAGKVGMNLQVYTETPGALRRMVELYLDYGLEDSAFLMLRSFEEANEVRAQSRGVALCVGEDRTNMARHFAFGVDFMQPRRVSLSDDVLARLKAGGIPFNVFSANTPEEMHELLRRGVGGILTDWPDRLLAVLREQGG